MPEKSYEFEPEIIKARVSSLKSGKHNAETARVTIWKIREAVTRGCVTWHELETTEKELMEILYNKLQEAGIEQRSIKEFARQEEPQKKFVHFQIKKFLGCWKKFQAGDQGILPELLFEFQEIKQLLYMGEIKPFDLQPDFPPENYFSLDDLAAKSSSK